MDPDPFMDTTDDERGVHTNEYDIGLWRGRRAHHCVAIGGTLALLGTLMFFIALLTVGSHTTESVIYCAIALVLCAGCTVSSALALKKGIPNAAAAFTLITFLLILITLTFMIVDTTHPECESNALYIFRCDPGEKQNGLRLGAQDAVIFAFFVPFFVAGVKLRRKLADALMRARHPLPQGLQTNDTIVIQQHRP